MLRLPSILEVKLLGPEAEAVAAPDVLIALNVLVDGRYYYGNLIGLTGRAGVARIERNELELRFASDRAAFPMDYKVDLDECDPQIEVALLSGAEFQATLATVQESPMVIEPIRGWYARATNSAYHPSLARIWADLPGMSQLTIPLLAVGAPGDR